MQERVLSPVEQAAIQQKAALDKLANSRYQLGDHMALHVLEALEVWCQLAQQTGNPAQLVARQQLQRYLEVMDNARAITAGIALPKMAVKGGNGGA